MPCRPDNVFHLLDGELTNAEASLVRQHFEGCVACRTLHEELLPLYKAFSQLSPPDLRPYEIARLKQRIMDGEPLSLSAVAEESAVRVRSRGKGWKRAVSTMLLVAFFMAGLACAYLAGVAAGTRLQPVCPPSVVVRASATRPVQDAEALPAQPARAVAAVVRPPDVDAVTSGGTQAVSGLD